MSSTDLSSAVLGYLNTHADAAAYRAFIYGGEVQEAGFVTAELLNAAVTARRVSGDYILAASVQDAGDDPVTVGNERAKIVIRHFDREYGYVKLRQARDLLMESLRDFSVAFAAVAGRRKGTLEFKYAGRTGHDYDTYYRCDWEGLVYVATLIVEED
jgi:hypothetical protein